MKKFENSTDFWAAVLEIVKPGHIAMSGGSALKLFDKLKLADFDWGKTTISIVDERCVPLDHTDSNSGQIQHLLCDTTATLNLFETPEQRSKSIEQYAKKLMPDGEGYLFDLTILGIGPDGHTASLFPDSPALNNDDLIVPSETEVFAVKDRMGLSFESINKSRQILVLMIGAGKSDIFHKLQEKNLDYHDFPAARILSMPQATVLWLNA